MPKESPLAEHEVAERFAALDGWQLADGRLHRELRFGDFAEAFGFMTRVALVAQALDHHPDWSNSWNQVVVDITSHDAGGLTERCFELAAAVDAAAGQG